MTLHRNVENGWSQGVLLERARRLGVNCMRSDCWGPGLETTNLFREKEWCQKQNDLELHLRSTGIPWVCKQTGIFEADVYPTAVFWDLLHGCRYPLVWGMNTHKQQYYRNVSDEKQGQEKRFDQKYFLSTVFGVEVEKKKNVLEEFHQECLVFPDFTEFIILAP